MRSGLPRENPLVFYPRRAWEVLSTYGPFAAYAIRLWFACQRIKRDPASRTYTDLALTPVEEAETEHLEMFEHTGAAKAAVAKAKARADATRGAAVAAE